MRLSTELVLLKRRNQQVYFNRISRVWRYPLGAAFELSPTDIRKSKYHLRRVDCVRIARASRELLT